MPKISKIKKANRINLLHAQRALQQRREEALWYKIQALVRFKWQ